MSLRSRNSLRGPRIPSTSTHVFEHNHVCLSPLPLEEEEGGCDDVVEFPYPWNQVHRRPSCQSSTRTSRSRASSLSSIVSMCSDETEWSTPSPASTHSTLWSPSQSQAPSPCDEAPSPARFMRVKPRGPRPLPKLSSTAQHSRAALSKPQIIIISPDPPRYSSDADACIVDELEPVDMEPSHGWEDAESPMDLLFAGTTEDDLIDWERIEEFMNSWDGYTSTVPHPTPSTPSHMITDPQPHRTHR